MQYKHFLPTYTSNKKNIYKFSIPFTQIPVLVLQFAIKYHALKVVQLCLGMVVLETSSYYTWSHVID